MTFKFKNKKAFIHITSAVLIFLFVYTGVAKLTDHSLFEYQLRFYPALKPFSAILSWTVPAIELIIACMLLFPPWQKAGLIAAAALLSLFTLYLIISVLVFSSRLPCSCGGIIQQLSWQEHILVNAAFIFIAVTSVYYKKRAMNLPGY